MDWIIPGVIGGIIVIPLLIALIRTFTIYEKDPEKPATSYPETTLLKYGKGLQKLIHHQTIAYKDRENLEPFLKMQSEMEQLFPLVSQHLEKTVFPGGSMIWKWKGKNDQAPLVLMAHQDVVPAPKAEWSEDPFSGKIKNGEIIGRGTFDTKCTLYAFFQAAEELLEQGFLPDTDIYLSSSSDEEVSGVGAELAVAWLESQNVQPGLVLDEGGAIVSGALPSVNRPIALVGVIEKGYLNLKFSAKSSGGHSSTPPKNTPIARLAAFINQVEKHFPLQTKMIDEVRDMFETSAKSMKFGYRFLFGNMWLFKGLITWLLPKINSYGRAMLSTTIAFTMMKGSDAENVIPAEAYVLCNLRTHPIQGIESTVQILTEIAKKYDVACEVLEGREATPIVNTSGKKYQFLVETIHESFPDVLVSPYVILGGTDARFFTKISDSALRFSPIRVTSEDLKKMHGIDESLKLEALAEAVDFYKALIQKYIG